jgi:maleylpyruvate isomerase
MLILHDYWRSGAGYRTRIALELKGLAYERVPIDLRTGAQASDAYRAINPQKLVPALVHDGQIITQSMAILEWLEECHPAPPLLPADAEGRAIVRGMANIIAADVHPLGNLRILNYLRDILGADTDRVRGWTAHWIGEGFTALEALVARHGGAFAYGDSPSFIECCLVPQLFAAERNRIDLTPYPRLVAVGERARALEAVWRAHPQQQSDADPA